ncbi:MAG: hypothetical protein JWO86_9260, partial [Myxococcaceae bacterium]|nr:hypothetical protein [Myxococcaceae bacterium]
MTTTKKRAPVTKVERAAKAAQRDAAVKAALDLVRAREDLQARRANDPVEFVHRHRAREDRE